jgi:hypothetical protein
MRNFAKVPQAVNEKRRTAFKIRAIREIRGKFLPLQS